jgi:hypothetical protein
MYTLNNKVPASKDAIQITSDYLLGMDVYDIARVRGISRTKVEGLLLQVYNITSPKSIADDINLVNALELLVIKYGKEKVMETLSYLEE